MSAYRWQRFKDARGRARWMLVPATATAPGLLYVSALADVFWSEEHNRYVAHVMVTERPRVARLSRPSTARAWIGRRLASLPNPPAIIGGAHAEAR